MCDNSTRAAPLTPGLTGAGVGLQPAGRVGDIERMAHLVSGLLAAWACYLGRHRVLRLALGIALSLSASFTRCFIVFALYVLLMGFMGIAGVTCLVRNQGWNVGAGYRSRGERCPSAGFLRRVFRRRGRKRHRECDRRGDYQRRRGSELTRSRSTSGRAPLNVAAHRQLVGRLRCPFSVRVSMHGRTALGPKIGRHPARASGCRPIRSGVSYQHFHCAILGPLCGVLELTLRAGVERSADCAEPVKMFG